MKSGAQEWPDIRLLFELEVSYLAAKRYILSLEETEAGTYALTLTK